MIISHSHKFIFVHIYKCAGTSMAISLGDYGCSQNLSTHATAFEIKSIIETGEFEKFHWDYYLKKPSEWEVLRENSNAWNEYFTFAFVRNPFDWMVSLYFWLINSKSNDMSDFARRLGFEGFLKHLRNSIFDNFKSGSGKIYRRPQSKFINDKDGRIVDFVGRFENLNNDFNYVCKRIGVKESLGKINAGNHKHYRKYYNENTKAIIRHLYKEDLELFGYEF